MHNKTIIGAAVALAALAGAAGHAAADDEILVGQIAGTTGAYGATGMQTVMGAQVAVDEINAKGGVLGKKLKLDWHNDNADGTLSGQLFKKLVSDGAVAIIGSPATGPVTAQLADRYKIPDLGVVDGGGLTIYPDGPDGKPHKWVFSIGGNTFAWGGIIAEYALKNCPDGIAVLHDRTSYGLGGLAGIKQLYDKAGKQITLDQPITENWSTGATVNLVPEIQAIKKAGVKCVVTWLSPQDQAAFAINAKSMGEKFTIFGNDEINADDTFTKLAGDAADGAIGAFLTSSLHPSKEQLAFNETYKKRFGQEPTQYSQTTYGSVKLLAYHIEQTKSTDHATLLKAFNSTKDYPGIAGNISFTKMQHAAINAKDLTLVKYDAKSKKWVEVGE
jgi:ABC-type branched-subunit amino acid transport system substrate-binding protein